MDVSQICTGNITLLSQMSVEEVLLIHPLLDPADLSFRPALKTKPLKAKPLQDLLIASEAVSTKFLLATLEASEALKAGAWICWGVANDVWQQTYEKLIAKYDVGGVDSEGWVTFNPKPDKPVPAAEVLNANFGPGGGFSVINPTWGDRRMLDGQLVHLHYGVRGDYVLQGLNDPKDTYRVAKSFFENTYEWQ